MMKVHIFLNGNDFLHREQIVSYFLQYNFEIMVSIVELDKTYGSCLNIIINVKVHQREKCIKLDFVHALPNFNLVLVYLIVRFCFGAIYSYYCRLDYFAKLMIPKAFWNCRIICVPNFTEVKQS